MAKTMAEINNNVVVNILWCADRVVETESLKAVSEHHVIIGDTYENGKFYRDGIEILTPLEESEKRNAELEAIVDDQTAALEVLLGEDSV